MTQPPMPGEEFSPEIYFRNPEELVLHYKTENLEGRIAYTFCTQTRILSRGIDTLTPANEHEDERNRILSHAGDTARRLFLTGLQKAA